MDIYNLVSFAGIFVLLGFAWLLSSDRKNMNFRVIFWGIVLQLLIASFIFVVPAGADVFRVVNDVVVKVLDSASAGRNWYSGDWRYRRDRPTRRGRSPSAFFWPFRPSLLSSSSRH